MSLNWSFKLNQTFFFFFKRKSSCRNTQLRLPSPKILAKSYRSDLALQSINMMPLLLKGYVVSTQSSAIKNRYFWDLKCCLDRSVQLKLFNSMHFVIIKLYLFCAQHFDNCNCHGPKTKNKNIWTRNKTAFTTHLIKYLYLYLSRKKSFKIKCVASSKE